MEFIEVAIEDTLKDAYKQLYKGAFLTTLKDGIVNTMTIGWGGVQIIWGKPVFVIYVRYTRHTYEMLEHNDEFTISVPVKQHAVKELSYCGIKSGRDGDKIQGCGLSVVRGRTMDTPIIKECDLHYECKIIYRQAMEPFAIQEREKNKYYKGHDYHVMYYGEIVDVYQTKGE